MGHIELPRYQSHKQVWALQIERVEVPADTGGPVTLHFVYSEYAPRKVPRDVYGKHQPLDGWYMVQYEDGYISFSPPEAFEGGYRRILPGENLSSSSDDRVLDTPVQQENRKLRRIQDIGNALYLALDDLGASKEIKTAKEKTKDVIFWATYGVEKSR